MKVDSELNVNSPPFHWCRDFACCYLGRYHSTEKRVRILLAMETFKSLHTQDKGEHEDVFYVLKYNPKLLPLRGSILLTRFHWYRSSGFHDAPLPSNMKCDLCIRKEGQLRWFRGFGRRESCQH